MFLPVTVPRMIHGREAATFFESSWHLARLFCLSREVGPSFVHRFYADVASLDERDTSSTGWRRVRRVAVG